MARGIFGWTLDDLLLFLKCHNFSFYKEKGGSHEAWISEDEKHVVEINVTHSNYPARTLETVIRQSGLSKDHWKKWTRLGGRDKKYLQLICGLLAIGPRTYFVLQNKCGVLSMTISYLLIKYTHDEQTFNRSI